MQTLTDKQTARLISALEAECSNSSIRVKAKDRRLTQQIAAQQRRSATGNKVSKGSKRSICSEGGYLPNRWNDSGRTKLGKEGIELSLLNERGEV